MTPCPIETIAVKLNDNIRRMAESPEVFRSVLKIDNGSGPTQFKPDDWQRRDFELLDPELMAPPRSRRTASRGLLLGAVTDRQPRSV